MAVNGRTRQRGAMTALIWKCQNMDVYVPEIVQTFGVQTLEKVNLTVAIERRVRGRVDFNDFTLRNIDPNFHDWELINGMCQDCTAFWRTRAVKRSRGKTDLSFLTCSNHQEPCGQRFYFWVGALEFLIHTSGRQYVIQRYCPPAMASRTGCACRALRAIFATLTKS